MLPDLVRRRAVDVGVDLPVGMVTVRDEALHALGAQPRQQIAVVPEVIGLDEFVLSDLGVGPEDQPLLYNLSICLIFVPTRCH